MSQGKIDIRPADLEIVQKILRDHLPKDAKVWVFGSRATWTTKDSSDLDLAIDAGRALTLEEMGNLNEAFENSDLPYKIDVVDMTTVGEKFRWIIEAEREELLLTVKGSSAWQTVCLGDICDFRAGVVFKPALQGQQSGRYPFIKVSDMNLAANAVRIQDANNWVSDEDLRELRAKPFPPGTVVFAKIGEALRQNRLRQVARETIVDNNMMGAVPRAEHVDPCYLYFALSKFDFSDIAQGTALPYLTVSSLSSLSLEIPPLSEQRTIAHILGTLDDKIELNRRMNEMLEAMARALFKSWFVDFDPARAKAEGRETGLPPDLAALFPDSFEDSELGEIPKGWKVGKFGEIAEHPKRSKQPNEIPSHTTYIALEHMPRRSIALADWGIADGIESNKFAFKKGEILFGKLRPYFHKVGVAPLDGVCSTDIVVVAPKSKDQFGLVLGYVSSNEFVDFTNAGSTGTKMPRTSWADMARYDVVVPTPPVAAAFTQHVRQAVERISLSIHEIQSLAALRDTLLPKLISGEIRVNGRARYIEAGA